MTAIQARNEKICAAIIGTTGVVAAGSIISLIVMAIISHAGVSETVTHNCDVGSKVAMTTVTLSAGATVLATSIAIGILKGKKDELPQKIKDLITALGLFGRLFSMTLGSGLAVNFFSTHAKQSILPVR